MHAENSISYSQTNIPIVIDYMDYDRRGSTHAHTQVMSRGEHTCKNAHTLIPMQMYHNV